MPINSARALSALTGKHAPAHIGAVLRPCEIRALVELVKLKQASLEGVTIIGVDCLGTVELADYRRILSENGSGRASLEGKIWQAALAGDEPHFEQFSLRPACQVCVHPLPEHVDIHLHLLGAELSRSLPVSMTDEVAAALDLSQAQDGSGWSEENSHQAAEKLIGKRQHKREQELEAIRKQIKTDGGMAGLFAACIRCHNCMTACPICYCKTCLFKSASFDHEPSYYLSAARRKGAQRMLGDMLLFHLTRLNHMSASCVSCGMCTSACPADIPVGMIFSAVAEQVQAAFEYIPGYDVDEPLPLVTFKPDEWTSVGESA
jgi:formate dehydrogenase subunit beta